MGGLKTDACHARTGHGVDGDAPAAPGESARQPEMNGHAAGFTSGAQVPGEKVWESG